MTSRLVFRVPWISSRAVVVSIERLGGNALQELARENSKQRPREVQGVVNVPSFVTLIDELALEFVQELEVKQIIGAQRFFADDGFHSQGVFADGVVGVELVGDF